jgi:isopentenyl-diphosphate delta-isomerase
MIRDQDISVILVDENDEFMGYGDKLEVHRKGLLHRAFSVFLYDDQGQMLIQQRALTKYHAGGLWANTCCGHPFPGEEPLEAANRRLFEELGLRSDLKPLTHIYYKKLLDHGMIEHEYVHVFQGRFDGSAMAPDPQEIMDVAFVSPQALRADAQAHPHKYAAWFEHYLTDYYPVLFAQTA